MSLMQSLLLRHEVLTNRQYHERPELGSSTLKTLDRDGAELAAARLDGSEQSDSRALVIGSAVHSVIEGTFDQIYVAAPDVRGYKTTDSDTFVAAAAEHEAAGQILLSRAEFARVKTCGELITRKLGTYLMGRQKWIEPSLFWTHQTEQGRSVRCKCRPDVLVDHGDGSACYVEIKTAADNCVKAWKSTCWRYGYWLQQAHYEAGIRDATGCQSVRTVFVVVRTTAPYTVRCYEFDEIDAAAHAVRWRALVEEYARRVAEHDWSDDSFLSPTKCSLGMTIQDDLEETADG